MYSKTSIMTDSLKCCPWRRNQENHKSLLLNSDLKWWFFWAFKGLSTDRASQSKLNGLKKQDGHVIFYMEIFKMHPKWEHWMVHCIFYKFIKALMCWAQTRINLLKGRSGHPVSLRTFSLKKISARYFFKYFGDSLMTSICSK